MSYVRQMQTINSTFGQDDGGVRHPKVECIMLNGCVFASVGNAHRCRTLGMCGCAKVYDATHEGQYWVVKRENDIVDALLRADMVHVVDEGTTDDGRSRTILLRPNLHCGIPRPNTTIDLHERKR